MPWFIKGFAISFVIITNNFSYFIFLFYQEAAQALIYADMAGSKLENIQGKVNEYLDRVQTLLNAGELCEISGYSKTVLMTWVYLPVL